MRLNNSANFLVFRRGIVYEGNDHQLWAVYPPPMVSPAVIVGLERNNLIFREDSFDPLTRIRRGRFYQLHTRSPWASAQVANGFYGSPVGIASHGEFDDDGRFAIADLPGLDAVANHEVQLGETTNATAWRIAAVEKNVFGQQVFTLRAKSLFGALPELSSELIDQSKEVLEAEEVKIVAESLNVLVDALHRQQPVPIVDVARETARVMVGAWLGKVADGIDLSAAAEKIACDNNANSENKCVARWAASIIARLHPRGKSAEQEKQRAKSLILRPIVDEDAECAVHLVGLLLRELGWSKP